MEFAIGDLDFGKIKAKAGGPNGGAENRAGLKARPYDGRGNGNAKATAKERGPKGGRVCREC
jgi:hypothetical protein